jgi:hypothetical protein
MRELNHKEKKLWFRFIICISVHLIQVRAIKDDKFKLMAFAFKGFKNILELDINDILINIFLTSCLDYIVESFLNKICLEPFLVVCVADLRWDSDEILFSKG